MGGTPQPNPMTTGLLNMEHVQMSRPKVLCNHPLGGGGGKVDEISPAPRGCEGHEVHEGASMAVEFGRSLSWEIVGHPYQ